MQVTGPGVVTSPYGMPSKFEKDVVRRTLSWLTASPISSISFTPLPNLKGIITPNGPHFERDHAGIPEVNPDEHQLLIHGLVERPIILRPESATMAMAKRRRHAKLLGGT